MEKSRDGNIEDKLLILDKFAELINRMRSSTDYLAIGDLKDQYSYKIFARNAYVGVWLKSKNAFLISRYKVGPNPYLFFEYHWDIGEPFGTVKPIELIGKFPFEIKEDNNDSEAEEILKYLDKLEEDNPIIKGVNSLKQRKMAAMNFARRLAGHINLSC